MDYSVKPKMILFDIGGTLFEDGKCTPLTGLSKIRTLAENPDVQPTKNFLHTGTNAWKNLTTSVSPKTASLWKSPFPQY